MDIKEFKFLAENKHEKKSLVENDNEKSKLIFTLWVWYNNDKQWHIRCVYVHHTKQLFDLKDDKQNERFKELFDKHLKDTKLSIMDWKNLIELAPLNGAMLELSDNIMEQEIWSNDLSNLKRNCLYEFIMPL